MTCSKSFDYGTSVSLTASPDAGAEFTQWTGACNGQGATCALTIKAATSTNAVFGLAGQPGTTSTNATTTTTTTTTTTSVTTTTVAGSTSHGVDAQLLGVKAGRSRLGFRVERVEIQAGQTLTGVVTLRRGSKRLARHAFTVSGSATASSPSSSPRRWQAARRRS